jgi:Domain of unknown function (DUF4351)
MAAIVPLSKAVLLVMALQTQIEALSLPQLEDLGEALLEFSRPEDLEDWLRTHRPE